MDFRGATGLNTSPSEGANKALRLLGVRREILSESGGVMPKAVFVTIDQLSQRVVGTETRLDVQSRAIDDAKDKLSKHDEHLGTLRADAAYVQHLLEALSATVEREKGVVSEHTEQLRYFAHHSRQLRAEKGGPSMYYIVVTWLYTPFLLFLKGVWLIFQPIVMTFRSLSLFSSVVLHEQQQPMADATDDDDLGDDDGESLSSSGGKRVDRSEKMKQKKPASLLEKLRHGQLDPHRTNK